MVLYNIDYFKNLVTSWEYRFKGDDNYPPETQTYAELHDEKVEACRKLTGYDPAKNRIIGNDFYFSCEYECEREYCMDFFKGKPLDHFRPCWSCKIKAAYEMRDELSKR